MRNNKINIYTCPDGHETITIDLEEGVTPFMLSCRTKNCGKMAIYCMYTCDQNLKPEYEWYRPTDFKKLNPGERQYVQAGGLLIRKI